MLHILVKTLLLCLFFLTACLIAGVDLNKVSTMDAADCLVATYARKLHGLRAPEKASLEVTSKLFPYLVKAFISRLRDIGGIGGIPFSFSNISTQGKKVILIEMGHTQSTAVVIKIGSFESSATLTKKLSHAFDGNLGTLHLSQTYCSFPLLLRSSTAANASHTRSFPSYHLALKCRYYPLPSIIRRASLRLETV